MYRAMPKAKGRTRYRAKRTPEFADEPVTRGFFGKSTWVVFGSFILAVCCALTLPVIPQYQKTKSVEAELAEAEKEEQRLMKQAVELGAQAEALKKNPGYLEARARDLRYHRRGEDVIEMDR